MPFGVKKNAPAVVAIIDMMINCLLTSLFVDMIYLDSDGKLILFLNLSFHFRDNQDIIFR